MTTKNPLPLSPTQARRLAVTRQRLAGPMAADIMEVVDSIHCLQVDPIRAVERTQYLVLWSRLGGYDPAELNHLLYEEKKLFEYWAHAASIVRTADYPIFNCHMRSWGSGDKAWIKRVRQWLVDNEALRQQVLAQLKARGPLASKEFEDNSQKEWESSGWTNGRNVNQMLDYLWSQGEIMVANRRGLIKEWDLTERCLPDWAPDEELDWPEAVRRSAEKSLRALGVARPRHIREHFTRGKYPDLEETLALLQAEGKILPVEIIDDGAAWPGNWYIHRDDLSLLESLENGGWQPRTTLLSPFDNLICDRQRTEAMWDFHFRIEIYVPKKKRQYGYYVLPILHGERLIGRIDPKMDRKKQRLQVNAVYLEDDAPQSAETGRAVAAAIENLAQWLGATAIDYGENIPEGWRAFLE